MNQTNLAGSVLGFSPWDLLAIMAIIGLVILSYVKLRKMKAEEAELKEKLDSYQRELDTVKEE